MAGVDVDKAAIDYAAGLSVRQIRAGVLNAQTIAALFVDTPISQADLEGMGYTADEAYLLLVFFTNQLGGLVTAFEAIEANLNKLVGIPLIMS